LIATKGLYHLVNTSKIKPEAPDHFLSPH